MSLNYKPIAEVDDVGLLAVPFQLSAPAPGLYDRVWISRGRYLNRYTGEVEYLTDPPGFGVSSFGEGVFGWN